MAYVKPEVFELGNAVEAIQTALKREPVTDGGAALSAVTAYEADE
jgi:hypothetical protein